MRTSCLAGSPGCGVRSSYGSRCWQRAVLVALLGWQNRGLRADRDWLTDRAAYAYPGMYVPVVETTAFDGAKLALGAPSGERQILFFFNHTCKYCRASAPTVGRDCARDQERVRRIASR